MKRTWVYASLLCLAVSGCHGGAGTIPEMLPAASEKHVRHATTGSVTIHPSQVGATVSNSIMGAGMGVWYNITLSGLAQAFETADLTTTRWPGGKQADHYHWKTNSDGPGHCSGNADPNSTFDNFMQDVGLPAHLDVSITVNYGSNAACTGGGDPSEAAGWVTYANTTKNYDITWWSVGNEQYTAGSIDLYSKPHDPGQYASNVTNYFYPQMKAASSNPINVCIDASPDNEQWDSVVLAQATYDCVELHYYPQHGTIVNDQYLLYHGAPGLTTFVQAEQAELSAAGHAGTPIFLGELGSLVGTPGKQTQSITQALYAGQVIGELLQDGVARATWHIGFGGCDPPSKGGDFSKSLYGWQNFGGAMIFSDSDGKPNCPQDVARRGTLMATARAYQVASNFVRNGERMLGVSVNSLPDVRAYATTYDGGYALMLFNLNETTAANVPVSIDGKSSGSGGQIVTYDKAIYDQTKNNIWNGPTSAKLSAWNENFTVSLPPWSMVVVQTQ
ncbi:MAG: hypothetical protein JOY69_02390 [Candidatus Eremiobacteraeota bacterium]|nr:hypothetical protein [Candidatus Eremiobacteraeota bacterium]